MEVEGGHNENRIQLEGLIKLEFGILKPNMAHVSNTKFIHGARSLPNAY